MILQLRFQKKIFLPLVLIALFLLACESFESVTEVALVNSAIESSSSSSEQICNYSSRGFPNIPHWTHKERHLYNHNRGWKPYFLDEKNGFLVGGDNIFWRTENGGRSWEGNHAECDCVLNEVNFVNDKVGFISLLDRVDRPADSFIHGGFIKTVDGGETWQRLESPQLGIPSNIHFLTEEKGFAVFGQIYSGGSPNQSRDFLARTLDGGLTWTEIEGINPLGRINNNLYFDKTGFGYTGGDNGIIYITEDHGETWREITTDFDMFSLQMIDAQNGFVYEYERLLKTNDGGTTWTTIADRRVENFYFFNEKEGIILQSVFTIDNGDYRDDCMAFLTTRDGGETWLEGSSSFNFYITGMFFLDKTLGFIANGFNPGCFIKIENKYNLLEEISIYE